MLSILLWVLRAHRPVCTSAETRIHITHTHMHVCAHRLAVEGGSTLISENSAPVSSCCQGLSGGLLMRHNVLFLETFGAISGQSGS